MTDRVVARCQTCGNVAIAMCLSDETLTVPGYYGCSACSGSLTPIDDLTDTVAQVPAVSEDVPFAGIVLQVLLHEGGGVAQDDLVEFTGRSPHLIRETLQQLEADDQITRTATADGWFVHLTHPKQADGSSAPEYSSESP